MDVGKRLRQQVDVTAQEQRPTRQELARAAQKEEENVKEMSVWIEHLKHPLVLAGFGLFVFALIIKPLFLNIAKAI